jgi:hypothetical protein
MQAPFLTLTADSVDAMWRVLLMAGVFIAAILLLTVVIVAARRRLLGGSEQSQQVGFTLGDLRAMYRRGELSEAEYNRAKDVLISQVRGGGADAEDERNPEESARKDEFAAADPQTRGDSSPTRR